MAAGRQIIMEDYSNVINSELDKSNEANFNLAFLKSSPNGY